MDHERKKEGEKSWHFRVEVFVIYLLDEFPQRTS